MALTIDRLTDRARQGEVEPLEREYFDWSTPSSARSSASRSTPTR